MSGQLPRPVLAVVIALPVLLAVAVVAAALINPSDGGEPVPPAADANAPLALAAVPAPAAASPECDTLVDGLPAALRSGARQLDRRPLADPAPAGAAAWGPADDLAVLRCGLDRPAELTRTAELLQVDGVRWLRLRDAQLSTSTWVAADRAVYVALTVSDRAGTGPLQDISSAIAAVLPAQPVQPAG